MSDMSDIIVKQPNVVPNMVYELPICGLICCNVYNTLNSCYPFSCRCCYFDDAEYPYNAYQTDSKMCGCLGCEVMYIFGYACGNKKYYNDLTGCSCCVRWYCCADISMYASECPCNSYNDNTTNNYGEHYEDNTMLLILQQG